MDRFTITDLEHIVLLRIDGVFVGSYKRYTDVSRVIDAYRGIPAVA